MKFDYSEAFSRNLGLISPAEQARIKDVRIAIAGMGGVGGVHLVTLLRMGFTKFTIADFDHFEVANFNRQFGASMDSLDRHKGEVMREIGLKINPEADIRLIGHALTSADIDDFLKDCSVFVDGIDVFEIQIRRGIYARARELGLWSVCAGPIGFSTGWVVYDPQGMSFEEYCGFSTAKEEVDHFIAFVVALTPSATHFSYLDPSYVSYSKRKGPSNMLACQLCSGVVGAEVLKIILGRGTVRSAPAYHQFDAYLLKYKTGRVWFGGNGPWPRLKRWIVKQRLKKMDESFDERLRKISN